MTYLCIRPACGAQCSDCNCAISEQEVRDYARRYAYLKRRPLTAITVAEGGVFAGQIPENVVLNGADLDERIDAAMASCTPN
jgi:hypothetical protein